MSGRIDDALDGLDPEMEALKRVVSQFSFSESMIGDDERKLVSMIVLEKSQIHGESVFPQIANGDGVFVNGVGSRKGNGRRHVDGGGVEVEEEAGGFARARDSQNPPNFVIQRRNAGIRYSCF